MPLLKLHMPAHAQVAREKKKSYFQAGGPFRDKGKVLIKPAASIYCWPHAAEQEVDQTPHSFACTGHVHLYCCNVPLMLEV